MEGHGTRRGRQWKDRWDVLDILPSVRDRPGLHSHAGWLVPGPERTEAGVRTKHHFRDEIPRILRIVRETHCSRAELIRKWEHGVFQAALRLIRQHRLRLRAVVSGEPKCSWWPAGGCRRVNPFSGAWRLRPVRRVGPSRFRAHQ